MVLALSLGGSLVIAITNTASAGGLDRRASLTHQTPSCSDFDVTLPGEKTPAFRVLLPEQITWEGREDLSGLHTIPGNWDKTPEKISGAFLCGGSFEISVTIDPKETEILAEMSFKNLTPDVCRNLRANICASVNHLPGEPGWANRDFIPASVPLDRDLQGRYWYEKATPKSLQAWVGGSWVPMHAFPGRADADLVDRYFFRAGESNEARACAVESQDGTKVFYQAWNAPCQYWSPFPGNACTHLLPLVAASLEPGEVARVRGRVGVFSGSRTDWAKRVGLAPQDSPSVLRFPDSHLSPDAECSVALRLQQFPSPRGGGILRFTPT